VLLTTMAVAGTSVKPPAELYEATAPAARLEPSPSDWRVRRLAEEPLKKSRTTQKPRNPQRRMFALRRRLRVPT